MGVCIYIYIYVYIERESAVKRRSVRRSDGASSRRWLEACARMRSTWCKCVAARPTWVWIYLDYTGAHTRHSVDVYTVEAPP